MCLKIDTLVFDDLDPKYEYRSRDWYASTCRLWAQRTTSSLRWAPKTPNTHSSENWVWIQHTASQKAPRRSLWVRRSTMSSHWICWVHHFTRARSKCRPTTCFSFWKRKLGVMPVQTSDQHGETRCLRCLKNRDSSFSQRRTLKYWSKNAELRPVRKIFVNFKDWYSRIVWNLATSTWSHEENEYNYTKNCLYKKKHYEKSILEKFKKNERIEEKKPNWRTLQVKLREVNLRQISSRSQLVNWRKNWIFMKNSRIPRSRLSIQWKIVPRSNFTESNFKPQWCAEPRTNLATRRKQSARYMRETFFDNLFTSVNTVSKFVKEFLNLKKLATYGDQMQPSTSEPVVSLLNERHLTGKLDESEFAKTSTTK